MKEQVMVISNSRAIFFPYCIEKQKDDSWVFLNRNYKPIGFNTDEFLDYGDYPVSMPLKGLGIATLQKLSYNGDGSGNRIYLYDDGCIPTSSAKAMSSYLEKLKILIRLQSA